MIEVQYFYTGTEVLLVKIVFIENRLFKDKFLEKVGGAKAPPCPSCSAAYAEKRHVLYSFIQKSPRVLVWTEALSGTLSAMLSFIHYPVQCDNYCNIIHNYTFSSFFPFPRFPLFLVFLVFQTTFHNVVLNLKQDK